MKRYLWNRFLQVLTFRIEVFKSWNISSLDIHPSPFRSYTMKQSKWRKYSSRLYILIMKFKMLTLIWILVYIYIKWNKRRLTFDLIILGTLQESRQAKNPFLMGQVIITILVKCPKNWNSNSILLNFIDL